MKDFSKTTLRSLARRGMSIIGTVAIPGDGDMPWANADRGYIVNDNGCSRILRHWEILNICRG